MQGGSALLWLSPVSSLGERVQEAQVIPNRIPTVNGERGKHAAAERPLYTAASEVVTRRIPKAFVFADGLIRPRGRRGFFASHKKPVAVRMV